MRQSPHPLQPDAIPTIVHHLSQTLASITRVSFFRLIVCGSREKVLAKRLVSLRFQSYFIFFRLQFLYLGVSSIYFLDKNGGLFPSTMSSINYDQHSPNNQLSGSGSVVIRIFVVFCK